MIGELLYSLSSMEERSAPVIQRRIERLADQVAAVVITQRTINVPKDKYFIVTSIACNTSSNAGQTTVGINFRIQDEQFSAASSVLVAATQYAAPIPVGGLQTSFDHVLLGPGELIEVNATFSAGAALNFLTTGVHGYFIPKGNLQLR